MFISSRPHQVLTKQIIIHWQSPQGLTIQSVSHPIPRFECMFTGASACVMCPAGSYCGVAGV